MARTIHGWEVGVSFHRGGVTVAPYNEIAGIGETIHKAIRDAMTYPRTKVRVGDILKVEWAERLDYEEDGE